VIIESAREASMNDDLEGFYEEMLMERGMWVTLD